MMLLVKLIQVNWYDSILILKNTIRINYFIAIESREKLDYLTQWGKYDDFAQIIRLKEVAGGKRWKTGSRMGAAKEISGLYASPFAAQGEVDGPSVLLCWTKRSSREILRTKGIKASLSPTDIKAVVFR